MKSPLFKGTILECIAWLSQQKEGLFEIFPHIKKRSLSANALYWECVGRISKFEKKPDAYIHNLILRRMNIVESINGRPLEMRLPDTDEAERQAEYDELVHLKPTLRFGEDEYGRYRIYQLLKGSSEFNVEEMTRLIDLVIDELRNYDLPVPGEEDIQRAIRDYERRHRDK